MKLKIALTAAALAALMASGLALAQHSAKETAQDIARHKAMAKAHTDMAACLEAKKPYDACLKDLQAACKGLGIGKYCGMRHEH
jgi:cytochrome c556